MYYLSIRRHDQGNRCMGVYGDVDLIWGHTCGVHTVGSHGLCMHLSPIYAREVTRNFVSVEK